MIDSTPLLEEPQSEVKRLENDLRERIDLETAVDTPLEARVLGATGTRFHNIDRSGPTQRRMSDRRTSRADAVRRLILWRILPWVAVV